MAVNILNSLAAVRYGYDDSIDFWLNFPAHINVKTTGMLVQMMLHQYSMPELH